MLLLRGPRGIGFGSTGGVRLLEVDVEEPVPSPEALTGAWSVAVATEALRLWAASGQSQENFAKAHGFPVSRFRSKAAIQARKG